MSKNRRGANHPGPHAPLLEDGHLHFRLCHLCLHLNEADQEIEECSECQHTFKDEILVQFFDNADREAFSDAHPDEQLEEAAAEERDEESESVKPARDLNGLSVRF